jgi:hypothetical protein
MGAVVLKMMIKCGPVHPPPPPREMFTTKELDDAKKAIIIKDYTKWTFIAKNRIRGIWDDEASNWLKTHEADVKTAIEKNQTEITNLTKDKYHKHYIGVIQFIDDCIKDGNCKEDDYINIKKILQDAADNALKGGRRRKTNKVKKSKVRVFRRRSSKSKKSRKSRK